MKTIDDNMLRLYRACASIFGVDWRDLTNRYRFPALVHVRQMTWYICERHGMTHGEIASMCARDRSTVSSGIKNMRGYIETEPEYKNKYRRAYKRCYRIIRSDAFTKS